MSKWSLTIAISMITALSLAALLGGVLSTAEEEVTQHVEPMLSDASPDEANNQAPLFFETSKSSQQGCQSITAKDRHKIDDWLLALQKEELQTQWQHHIDKLDVCLQAHATAYLNYKSALAEVDENLNIFERHELLMALQRQYFSVQLIERWFADENRWNEHALERWQILADKRSSSEQKERLIAQHISQLSDTERQLIHSSTQITTLSKNLPDKTPNELIAQYGEAAAQRLVELNAKQTQWREKLLKFEQQRLEIMASDNTQSEQLQQIERLKQTMFNSAEQKRLPHAFALIQSKHERN
ncbi:hypothetical protein PA25_33620 [Pseudoalteromonas sp. A25]|uniref:lipase secretion chaperone n=1 Tax=Pseudoalteromonas sp. A25 TaxID=116092 RepID=UPI001260E71F|nr:lipase secretion chaperone [Pseudoalteromonas sp. A25]BBN83377.1 hypothetical protein PA25_33620 [Pseudoalteromonas sp. A25]